MNKKKTEFLTNSHLICRGELRWIKGLKAYFLRSHLCDFLRNKNTKHKAKK